MSERVTIDLGDHEIMRPGVARGQHAPSGTRKVDIARKFRRVILLVVCLYALSSFQTTVLVDRIINSWL